MFRLKKKQRTAPVHRDHKPHW